MGHVSIVQELLKRGSRVNVQDEVRVQLCSSVFLSYCVLSVHIRARLCICMMFIYFGSSVQMYASTCMQ